MAIQRFKVTPTVTAGAYSANDVVGGLLTFTGCNGGTLQGVTICDNGNQTPDYRIIFFESQPTSISDNATYDIADADLDKIVFILLMANASTAQGFTDNIIYYKFDLDAPIRTAGGTLYAYLITDGTPTYAATSDVTVTLQFADHNERVGI